MRQFTQDFSDAITAWIEDINETTRPENRPKHVARQEQQEPGQRQRQPQRDTHRNFGAIEGNFLSDLTIPPRNKDGEEEPREEAGSPGGVARNRRRVATMGDVQTQS